MLKHYILSIFLFSILQTYSQNGPDDGSFDLPPQSSETALSKVEQNRLKKLKSNQNYRSVRLLRVENLGGELGKDRASFNLHNGIPGFAVSKKHMEFTSENDFLYSGEIEGGGTAILAQRNGRVSGNIQKNGRVFDIEYLENGYVALIEYDMNKIDALDCAVQEDTNKMDKAPSEEKPTLEQTQKGTTETSKASGATIDVLVLYTQAAEDTGRNITDLSTTARGQWLTSQINSHVSANLKIVGVEPLAFNETEFRIDLDIVALRNNIIAQQLRNQYWADLVVLITDGNYPGILGIVSSIGPDEDDAYSIVQVDAATSGHTFIHETGHLFGARHEFSLTGDDTPGDAHGHQWKTGWWPFIKKYNSVMKTNDGKERVLHFSNPYVTHESKATGVVGVSHNVWNINGNGQTVADFRYTAPDMIAYIYGKGMANDGESLTFTSSVSNGQSPISYNWQVNTGSGYFGAWSGYSLTYTMPAGKNLNVKLTVTGGDGQTSTAYHTVQNSFLGGGPCTKCPDIEGKIAVLTDAVESEEELATGDILFPNPSSGTIYLKTDKESEQFDRYEIVDISGAMVQEQKIDVGSAMNQNTLGFDISKLSKGIYVLRLMGSGSSISFKFVKK